MFPSARRCCLVLAACLVHVTVALVIRAPARGVSHRVVSHRAGSAHFAGSDGASNADYDSESEVAATPRFFAKQGIESVLTFDAERRNLLPSELQLAFRHSVALKKSALISWPDRLLPTFQSEIIRREANRLAPSVSEIAEATTLLSSPSCGVSALSNALLLSLISGEWTQAVRFLNSRGLLLEQPVVVQCDGFSAIDVSSLWKRALDTIVSDAAGEEGRVLAQDALLSVLRLAVRECLADPDTAYVVADIRIDPAFALASYFPPRSATRTVLTLDFTVLEVFEDVDHFERVVLKLQRRVEGGNQDTGALSNFEAAFQAL